jgi:CBS-domain-containing membrane protein
MTLKVSDCMSTDPVTCQVDDSDSHAAHLMWDRDCGVIPVVDSSRNVIGMVTDRDLCMSASMHAEPFGALHVSEAMSRDVKSCRPGDALEDALEIMANHQLHRLAVLDDEQHLTGVLSLADCARFVPRLSRASERQQLVNALCETLAAICEPRQARPGTRSADAPREARPGERPSMSA